MSQTSTKDPIAEAPSAARAAALWWAKQVGAPIFRNVGDTDSPEDQAMGDMAGIMMSVISSGHPVTEDQGTKFADEVERRIADMLKAGRYISLGVDYGPDLELFEAAQAAGIHASRFPWKTHMSVKWEYVTAALGYGAQPVLIWTAPGWIRPACDVQRYDEVDGKYVCRDEVCTRSRFHEGDHGDYQPDPKRCRECGGTYSAHYGNPDGWLGHSYDPAVQS
jgi:hypothetical protein